MRVVLLPVKDPSKAKQRLATALSSEERIALTWAMLKDVGQALAGAKLADRIVVVTNDPAPIQQALGRGWEVLRENEQISESQSVDWASSYLMKQGAAVVLRLPGDIPLLRAEDVDSLFSIELAPKTALLVPSRDGAGTNALLRKPPDAFPSRFGPNSCRLHRQEACRVGVAVKVIKNPRIALDIDDVTDLAVLLAQDRQTLTARAINDLSLAGKLLNVREQNHATPELRVIGIPGLPEVGPGERLGDRIAGAIRSAAIQVQAKDVIVVTQKIVSKAEGRVVRLDSIQPSSVARCWAEPQGKDPRLVDVILSEARRVVRMDRGVLIVETHHGFVCANGGVDVSNTEPGTVTLLPKDPDASAEEIRETLERVFGLKLAVIISDTFGRPWRDGLVNVALGVAGLNPLEDYRGKTDSWGQSLTSTVIALADEVAAAAELVMGKTRGIPVALVRGVDYSGTKGTGRQLIRPAERDLFR